MKLGAHFLPEDFPTSSTPCGAAEAGGLRATPGSSTAQMLWQDLYVYMTHALAATERIVVGSGGHEPAHAPPDGDRERASRRSPSCIPAASCSGSAAATTRCGRSG